LKEVPDPQRFGVPQIEGTRIVCIEEKPHFPKSSYAVTGTYMYDHRVFTYCRDLKPSARGELEITDVNNAYIQRGDLEYDFLRGWWTDAGQFESLYLASTLVERQRQLDRSPADLFDGRGAKAGSYANETGAEILSH
jgi:glucose-1-phosphate thymidylyltransferase